MENIVIIIPSLEPSTDFINTISELKLFFPNVIVVDDGSSKVYEKIFDEIVKLNVIVLKHSINLGKGRALKTAFNYVLNNYENCTGIVMADSDGQHSLIDIKKMGESITYTPDSLILGVRNFNDASVPFKSKFGNKTTRFIFKLLLGLKISDTQTGLRAMGVENIKLFLETSGERFEYETNMLLDTKKFNIPILEVPIETIYIEENNSSHFNPIKDSIRIYSLFLKYIFSAISSFAVDISLFWIFINAGFGIIFATYSARTVSSMYNYLINKGLVFKGATKSSIYKYYILVLIQVLISGFAVELIFENLNIENIVIIKIIVDTLIFISNFYIQREWVFSSSGDRK